MKRRNVRLRHQFGAGLTGNAGEKAWIIGPHEAWAGQCHPLIALHGNGSDARTFLDGWAWAPYLAQRGFLVCVPDAAGASNWGRPLSSTRVTQALDKLNALGATGPAVLFGGSMGAITALNFTRLNPTRVRAVALTTPALDLSKYLGPEVTAAYGTATPDMNLYSPKHYAANLPSELRIRLWTASDDTAAPEADHAAPFVAARPQTEWTQLGAVGGHAGGQVASAEQVFDWVEEWA